MRHTKIYVLWICMILFWLSSRAQSAWGFMGGLNVSTTRTSYYTYPFSEGFNAGICYELALSKRISLSAESLYSSKGNYTYGDMFLRLKYICIPVLAKYKLIDHLYLIAGAESSYLLTAFTTSRAPNFHITSTFRRIDIGLVGGLRYSITKKIGIDLREVWGLTGIEKPDIPIMSSSSGTDVRVIEKGYNPRNVTFQAGLYYNISARWPSPVGGNRPSKPQIWLHSG